MSTTGRWVRKLRWAVAGVILVAVIDAAIRTEPIERALANVVETALEVVTGERVVLGKLELNPVALGATVKGVIVSHEGPDGLADPVVTIDSMRMRLGLPVDGAWIRDVEVDRPVVSLHIDKDGLREFRNARSSSERTDLPWKRIQINNARLEIDSPVGVLLLEGMNATTRKGDEIDITVQTARLMGGGIDEVARTVEANRVRFSPNGVAVPEFRLESEHSSIAGNIDAEFGGVLRGDATASIVFSVLDPLVGPEESFEGIGHLDLEFGGTVREPMARGVALIEGFGYRNQSNPSKLKTISMDRLVAPILWSGSRLTAQEAHADWADGTLAFNADIDLVAKTLETTVLLESVSLREGLREAGGHRNAWVDFVSDGEVTLSGTFSPLRLEGTMEIASQNLRQRSGAPDSEKSEVIVHLPKLNYGGGLEVTSEGVWLKQIALRTQGSVGTFDAFIGREKGGLIDVRLDFERFDLSELQPMKGLGLSGAGPMKGGVAGQFRNLKAYARGQMQRFQMADLYLADSVDITVESDDFKTLKFTKINGRLGSSQYRGQGSFLVSDDPQMDLNVDISDGRMGDLVRIGRGTLDWIDGRVTGAISLVGSPKSIDGEFAFDFRDVDLLGEAFPAGSVAGSWDQGDIRIDQAHLSRWNGTESVFAQGSVSQDWQANLAITATGFDLSRLDALEHMQLPAEGSLTLDAVLQGNLLSPQPKGRIALMNTQFAGKPVPDSTVSFRPSGESIAIEGSVAGEGLTFTGVVGPDSGQLFSVDASLRSFPVHSVFPVAADGSSVTAEMTGSLSVVAERLDGETVYGIKGTGRSLDVDWDRHSLRTLGPWTFESTGQSVRLSDFRLQGGGTDISWNIESNETGHLHGIGDGVVDADLARMVVPGLERAEGPISVAFGVDGTMVSPEWTVDLAMAGVTMQGDWFPHPVEGLYGVVQIKDSGMAFRRLDFDGADAEWVNRQPFLGNYLHQLARYDGIHGQLGDGSVVFTGGFSGSDWKPVQFDIQADVSEAKVQFIEALPPFKGDASLVFTGPASDALLTGNINVTEMLFTERITWEEWMLEFASDESIEMTIEESKPAFSMDIVLKSDNTIEVQNNVGDLTAGGELRVVGDTNQPGLLGSIVAIPGGRMHLKEREFELTRGEILYVDPYSFDPELDLVLNTEVRSREDTYDVTYRVGGTLDDWRAETRSDPNLPPADVNALLLFGMTRAELERYGGLAGALAVEGGDLLASSFLFSARDDTERGGLFRIVDPLRPERLDLVSGVSERGSGLVNSELRLLYENELSDLGLNGGMMILEQNISRASDTYLGFEQRLARQLYARTYWGSEQVGRFLDVGGAYGLEMKVRWELD